MEKLYIGKERVTDRDIEVATWIAEQGCARLDTIGNVLINMGSNLEARRLRSLALRWEKLGLVKRGKLLAKVPLILWTTKQSLKLAGLPNQSKQGYKPSFTTLHHQLAVSHIRTEYEKHGAKWLSEAKLRMDNVGHLPDGIASFNLQKIIVEVDRTEKSGTRLEKIMIENAIASGEGLVDYWVTPEMYNFADSHRLKLPGNLTSKIRIFTIPREVL